MLDNKINRLIGNCPREPLTIGVAERPLHVEPSRRCRLRAWHEAVTGKLEWQTIPPGDKQRLRCRGADHDQVFVSNRVDAREIDQRECGRWRSGLRAEKSGDVQQRLVLAERRSR